uniref:AAA+ ATPase domain-containing protein n=1 Tax=Tetradesmus obliquus TaxID=3088 RepID=A0A383VPB5_TETOB
MEINSDLIMQYGLMSKLSTGWALLDAILVMLVPLLVNRLLPQLHTFVKQLFTRAAPPEQTHERVIIHKQNPNRSWWYSADDEEHPNHKLQQAIIVYLNTLPELFSQLESCDVQLCKAKRKPAAAAAGGSEEGSGGAGGDDGSSAMSSDDDWYAGMELEQYEVKMVPPLDTWIAVEPGLSFKRSEAREGSDKESQLITTYMLVVRTAAQVDRGLLLLLLLLQGVRPVRAVTRRASSSPLTACSAAAAAAAAAAAGAAAAAAAATAAAAAAAAARSEAREGSDKESQLITTYMLVGKTAAQVDGWVAKAYDAYRAMLKGEQAASKADRYLYLPVLHAGEGEGEGLTYRRYKLSDDKSFDNLFHAEKEELLNLVDAFMHKRGKFAIKGYPHKLGFLLHGPPGTGKTSFIKALACHSKRSIISIPLSRIKTNQQLMDMMFDQRVQVEGEDMKIPLPFSKTIFVMEDVDAASHVVQKRDSGSALAASLASLMGPQASSKTKAAAKDADIDDDVKAGSSDKAAAAGADAAGMGMGMGGAGGRDTLNLAGLLNVLDGVVDTPGRLIVMSTNHPEKLDPALIRPGRINKKVYMGNLAAAEALAMVQHYFADISPCQQQQLLHSWVDGVVSPAALEALCAEHEKVEGLLAAAQQLLAGIMGSSSSSKQRKVAEGKVSAAAAACCEGSFRSSSSSFIIRASSCTASFAV